MNEPICLQNAGRQPVSLTAFIVLILCGLGSSTFSFAGDVDLRVSAREAYVGAPIYLDLEIIDTESYEPPEIPSVDGLEINSLGVTQQSSSYTSINGVARQTTSLTLRYELIPQRAGDFELPSLQLKVDGTRVTTSPLKFTATISDTGDLLFAELVPSRDKVYVGEPLEITLRIWIRPYVDRERKIRLSEGDMWSLVSNRTQWGAFTSRMRELDANRQRPGGDLVTRPDADGVQREYYMYELTTTIYPKQAGEITSTPTRVILNYPTALVEQQDPLGSLLQGSFGGRSPLADLLDDDMIPRRRRLAIGSTRPIEATANVDATDVLPVPEIGRPSNYRGAVGRYTIEAQASPRSVREGDPINVDIAIRGTGPLELVSAPPLAEQTDLARDFIVPTDPLAGFIRDGTKYFSTTIRPKRAGVTTIPPIQFSFFDPNTEQFETIQTEPIAIAVGSAETLALDAIVTPDASGGTVEAPSGLQVALDMTNTDDEAVLIDQSLTRPGNAWWGLFVGPPAIFAFAVAGKLTAGALGFLFRRRSAQRVALARLRSSHEAPQLIGALSDYLLSLQSITVPSSSQANHLDPHVRSKNRLSIALGGLRANGYYELAASIESWSTRVWRQVITSSASDNIEQLREEGLNLVHEAQLAWRQRRNDPWQKTAITDSGPKQPSRWRTAGLLWIFCFLSALSPVAIAADPATPVSLVNTSREAVLKDAQNIYTQARALTQSGDAAEATELYLQAAEKYQWLIDAGVQNGNLFRNLANAELGAGRLGRAIAGYEQALAYQPADSQSLKNLAATRQRLVVEQPAVNREDTTSATTLLSHGAWLSVARNAAALLGEPSLWLLAAGTSVLFWGLCTVRLLTRFRPSFSVLLAAGACFVFTALLIIPLISAWQSKFAIVIDSDVTLRQGDGATFDAVVDGNLAEGSHVSVLASRGGWTMVKSPNGAEGWIIDYQIINIQRN